MNKRLLNKIAQVPLGEYVYIKYYGKYRKWKVLYTSVNALGEVTFNVELCDYKGEFKMSKQCSLEDLNKTVFLTDPLKSESVEFKNEESF